MMPRKSPPILRPSRRRPSARRFERWPSNRSSRAATPEEKGLAPRRQAVKSSTWATASAPARNKGAGPLARSRRFRGRALAVQMTCARR